MLFIVKPTNVLPVAIAAITVLLIVVGRSLMVKVNVIMTETGITGERHLI
jgi:hypothetical protein